MSQIKDIDTLLALAEQGDNRARGQIGSRYYYGRGGVEQNYKEAAKWFKAAGWYGQLGRCYLYGHGVEQNYEEAVKCFLAAEDKDMLGECYLHGLGVERNVNKTIELWETACDERCRYYDVMLKLAHLYGDGIEMEPDYKKALNWWYQLAENDSGDFGLQGAFPEAMYQLANYYYEGNGVRKNLKLALKYFRYTIDLFLENNRNSIHYVEYDRDHYVIKLHSHKIEGNITISDEPSFIIHSRKVLVKHGCKSVINKIKKAAQNGDKKAAQILNEFGIGSTAPAQPEPVVEEAVNEIIFVEEAKRATPIQLTIGETVTHRTFGEGVVCESNGSVVCVEFASVGKKKFLNPEAFSGGYLSLARLI